MTTETHTVIRGGPALDPRRWLALTVISVATLMVVLDASIINIALPHAQADLDISDAMTAGIAVALAGTLWLTLLKPGHGYLPVVLPAMILAGLGLGVFFVAPSNIALAGTSPSDTGVASAMISTTLQVGGAIGPALLNTLYLSALTGFLAGHTGAVSQAVRLDGYVQGYRVAFLAGAALFALTLAATGLLVTSRRASAATA
ncbi:hypothetical protein [Streptomyces sp. NPDC058613]|uniref:hypothetical protein n=1 Tax=unclassified Streptomyces TaxID=2593676 RepID=UPI0036607449